MNPRNATAIVLWLALVLLAGCESGPYAISTIRPDTSGAPVIIDGKDRGRNTMRPQGTITANDAATGRDYRVKLTGAAFGGDGGDKLDLRTAYIYGTGEFITETLTDLRRNIRGTVTVRQTPLGRYVLSTDADDEFIAFGNPDGQSAVLAIPDGEGSVFRFRGRVENFFDGYTFESEGGAPLEFTLTAETGLTHTGGAGKVIGPDGAEASLLPPADGA